MREEEQQKVLLKYRLTFPDESVVNWCPGLGTVLANDEVKDGVSERGGHPVERKLMSQWFLRITKYADRLLEGLETVDYPESLKEMQKNWIVRRANQPLFGEPTAYVFKDHGGDSAASLIERAGLKGTQVGKVDVLDRNANFFVARQGATSADFLRLVELVRSQVQERFDVNLALAIQVW